MQSSLTFVISQLSHIEQAVNEVRYPEIQYPELVPVDTSANEWAKSVTYFSSDKTGRAKWVNGLGDDIPFARTQRQKHETDVHMAAIGYSYSLEEVMQARQAGIDLPGDDARAARRAYEEFVDNAVLLGDSEKNYEGLFNNSTVTAASAGNGDWNNVATTSDEIIEDINEIIQGISAGTNYMVYADTLLLPYAKLELLAKKRLDNGTIPNSDITVLDFIKSKNVYTAVTGQPLTIRAARGLETAGSGSVNRMVAYLRRDDVLKVHIPMPHRFIPVQVENFTFKVPGMFRFGGLEIRRPKEVRYSDGI